MMAKPNYTKVNALHTQLIDPVRGLSESRHWHGVITRPGVPHRDFRAASRSEPH